MSTTRPDPNGITSIWGYHEALGHKWQLFLPMGTVKVKPISISHYKHALGWSKKKSVVMPHTSAVYQLWHLELSLTLLSPSFLAFEAEEYNNYRSQAFSPCCSRGNNTLLLCLHPTPHPHLSLLVTFLEFCNPSLSSLPLEILLSSFWQKLLLPVCDTLTHFMQLYYNRTGRWNWKLTHFWRTCCVPGTVQRIFTRS